LGFHHVRIIRIIRIICIIRVIEVGRHFEVHGFVVDLLVVIIAIMRRWRAFENRGRGVRPIHAVVRRVGNGVR